MGNQVFDRLIESHGETSESRLLFLYGITTNTRWDVLNSTKWVHVQADGVTLNFDDSVIIELGNQWNRIKSDQDQAETASRLRKFREEHERPTPRDGDTFSFWSDPGTFREIRL